MRDEHEEKRRKDIIDAHKARLIELSLRVEDAGLHELRSITEGVRSNINRFDGFILDAWNVFDHMKRAFQSQVHQHQHQRQHQHTEQTEYTEKTPTQQEERASKKRKIE